MFTRRNSLRGRWKHKKRIVDMYLDTTIPFPDAKVAASLCIGDHEMYDFIWNSGLDDCWVLENIVPNVFKVHGCKKTAAVLDRAVLYACFDPLMKGQIPQDIF